MPMGEIVLVLDASDLNQTTCLGDLRPCRITDAHMPKQSLVLEPGERLDLRCDGSFRWAVHIEHRAEVHSVKLFDAEVAQVIVDGGDQLRRRACLDPGPIATPASTDLRDQRQIIRVRMQSFTDNLIGDVGSVEVAGVDMIDPAGDDLTQDCDSLGSIARRAEDALSGKLHGAIAHALHRTAAKNECAIIGCHDDLLD